MEEHIATWVNVIVNIEPEPVRHYLSANSLSAILVIVALMVLVRLGTKRLEMRPTRGLQVLWEWVWQSFEGLSSSIIGAEGSKHTPFLGTVFIYVVALSLLGVIPGFVSPTASLSMTLALALVTVGYVQVCGFRAHGWRYVMHFVGEPLWLAPLNIPIHLIGELARIISLAVRLFGNIFGEDTVIAQLLAMAAGILAVIHVPIPLHFPMVLFHIFVSFVQALVFTMLAAAYISGAVEHHDEAHEGHEAHETAQAV